MEVVGAITIHTPSEFIWNEITGREWRKKLLDTRNTNEWREREPERERKRETKENSRKCRQCWYQKSHIKYVCNTLGITRELVERKLALEYIVIILWLLKKYYWPQFPCSVCLTKCSHAKMEKSCSSHRYAQTHAPTSTNTSIHVISWFTF